MGRVPHEGAMAPITPMAAPSPRRIHESLMVEPGRDSGRQNISMNWISPLDGASHPCCRSMGSERSPLETYKTLQGSTRRQE